MTELTSEEVLKILEKQAEKEVKADGSPPVVDAKTIEENFKKKGKVWKKEKEEKPKK